MCESDLSLGEQLALIAARKSSKFFLKSIPPIKEQKKPNGQTGRLDKRTLNIFRLIGGSMKDIYNFVDEACDKSKKMKDTAEKYNVEYYTVARARHDSDKFIETFRNIVKLQKEA